MILNSPNGIKSAFEAGIKCIMVPDKVQPTEEIKKLPWKIISDLEKIREFL